MSEIAKLPDAADHFGPTSIGDFNNRAACAINTQQYGDAKIRIFESDTPLSMGLVGKISTIIIADCGDPVRRNVGRGRLRTALYR